MKWEKVLLGEVTDSCLGKMLDQEKNRGEYQPYLANVDVRWGSFNLDDLSEMRFEKDEQERYGLKYGDLVVCEGGEPGRCAIWKNQIPNMKIQKALHRVRVHDCLDYRYLYYWFLLAGKTGGLEQYFTGATIKHMPGQKLKSVVIDKPPIGIQRSIADVLSSYDDLIENNQKQIKLLEEAAQRLYKEWFVDLCFPGHENTKITDGVPEGWRMAVLSEIASVNKESISKQYPYDYVDYIDIGAVSKGQINSVTRLSTKDAPGRAKRIAFDGDVLWGMVRPNLKSYALVFHPKETSVFSTGFAILHAEKVPFSFLYCHVTQDEFVSYLINCTNGAAYPAVKPSHFENAVLLVPTDMVLSKFHSLVGQMFRQAAILEQKNQQAIEARDRLLPKLMSGEIEV